MSGRALTLIREFCRAEHGTAAVEMMLWTGLMMMPIVNAVDLGLYTYQRMQVETAANAAVSAAWHDCNAAAATPAPPPAITTCKAVVGNVITHMQTAAQSTTLGTAVSLPTANISEGYYCANSSGVLTLMQLIGTAASPPTTNPSIPKCTGTTTPAGDYIFATVTFTYTPLFSNASILSLIGGTTTRTAWMRLDK
jgi:Flp pilus assembly protein TadG